MLENRLRNLKNKFFCRFVSYDFSWQAYISHVKVIAKGRWTNIYVIIFIIVFLIINYIFKLIDLKNKIQKFSNDIESKINLKPQFFSKYENSIQEKLYNFDFPYKLNFKKYLILKYLLPVLVFIVSVINYKKILFPIILAAIVHVFPDLLIKIYNNKQNIQMIKELKVINTNMILYLSSYASLKDAIKLITNSIRDKRIKKHFSKFAYEYEITNFNIKKSADNIIKKFQSKELEMFMRILIQSENEGGIIENLERFNATLELSYFKYLNSQANKRLTLVVIGTILMLGNIIVICMYPIIIQVFNSLQQMFSW